jgi:hypothetical protein
MPLRWAGSSPLITLSVGFGILIRENQADFSHSSGGRSVLDSHHNRTEKN